MVGNGFRFRFLGCLRLQVWVLDLLWVWWRLCWFPCLGWVVLVVDSGFMLVGFVYLLRWFGGFGSCCGWFWGELAVR